MKFVHLYVFVIILNIVHLVFQQLTKMVLNVSNVLYIVIARTPHFVLVVLIMHGDKLTETVHNVLYIVFVTIKLIVVLVDLELVMVIT